MKQYIDIKQLNELNNSQLKNLNDLLYCPHLFRIAYTEDYDLEVTNQDYIEATCRITIGRMIETIGDSWVDKIYSVNYDHEIYKIYKGELCDNLWEELKSEL